MNFDDARKVADAVLFEGYVLYPYRASAAKNRVRWQFGVVAPKAWSTAGGPERCEQQTQCLLESDDSAVLELRVRFLHVQAKVVEAVHGDGFTPVETLTVDGTSLITWEEAVEHQVDLAVPVATLLAGAQTIQIDVDAGGEDPELVHDATGAVAARVLRTRQPLSAALTLSAERLDGPFGAIRLTVRTENLTPYDGDPDARKEAMSHSLVACHTLLGLSPEGAGRFISLLEPPEWAKPAAEACKNIHTFPVMIGDRGREDVMLSSPITLYDWPQIAPESPGDLFDATEIDEILILRTMTLTDEEKAEARATDPRAAAIIDRVDDMPQEIMDRLHGAVRYLRDVTSGSPRQDAVPEFGTGADGVPVFGEHRPFGEEFADRRPAESSPIWDPANDPSVNPDKDTVTIGGVLVAKGDKVVLRPGTRRSDAQDMFLAGKVADVQAVFHDLEDKMFLAVTLEEDINADIQIEHGRFLYFSPDEVEAVESVEGGHA
ncbi:MAG: hypothetical protein QOD01_1521 [Actinomycetota bacterium]|nr:hypothetical protein [Actinomycetota bacterium]